MIAREPLRVRGPDRGMLEQTRAELRAIHARAFDWSPPDIGVGEQLSTTRIRQYVRRWINEWDLKRLYPDYTPEMVVGDMPVTYTEQPELETPEEAPGNGDATD
jgi:hypothetical protein